jgi:hypothetical protein
LQPANKEAGLFLERLLKGVFEAGDRREGIKTKTSKKTSDKFSESQKVYYFCTPPRREKREGLSGQNGRDSLEIEREKKKK